MTGLSQAFLGTGWHQWVETALKMLALFIVAGAAFRVADRRAMAEMTPLDWVTAIATGAIIGRNATATDGSWMVAIVALVTLLIAHGVVTRLRFIPQLTRVFDPPTRVLIQDGQLQHKNLKRCGFTPKDLQTALRQNGYRRAEDVHLALFEPMGAVSVFSNSEDSHSTLGV